ncbi:MAG: 2,3-bisphosphoglycerate-independent phosphoglycerate mutase, partial [Acidimicrobiia bacterium]
PDNAVELAYPGLLRQLAGANFPGATAAYTELKAHGTAVGMPSDADMGNSEVGHNTIGAGRVLDQGAKQVEDAIASGAIWEGTWRDLVGAAQGHTLHFVGLLSDGNVHSNISHLKTMIEHAVADGVESIAIHPLFDGRDVSDHTAEQYLLDLEECIERCRSASGANVRVASGGGRMATTMDRYEADWAMVERGWQAHAAGTARPFHSAGEALAMLRKEDPGVSDQYLPSFTVVDAAGEPVGRMQSGDAVVLFNFRGDRMIEIYKALDWDDFDAFDRGADRPRLFVVGMTEYDGDAGIPKFSLVQPPEVNNTVSEIIAAAGLHQFAVAETQKFGHVTYFWNGNRAEPFDRATETYCEIPSDNVRFEERPWMKSAETADAVIEAITSGEYAFIRANFAGGDMVGHSGDIEASVVAVEAIDLGLVRILDAVAAAAGTLVITADHGNCEELRERTAGGVIKTSAAGDEIAKKSHTLSPVPFALIDFQRRSLHVPGAATLPDPGLANIGAVVLDLLGLEVPASYEHAAIEVS